MQLLRDDQSPSPRARDEAHSDDDDVELKLSYADFARLYDSSIITYSQLRRGRVHRNDIPRIEAFLKNSDSPPTPEFREEFSLDLPEDLLAQRSRRVERFDRDFIVDGGSRTSRSNPPPSNLSVALKQPDERRQSTQQQQQPVIVCDIQDTVRFQVNYYVLAFVCILSIAIK